MFQNKYGKWSSVRFIFLLFGLCFCSLWTYVSIKTQSLAEVNEGVRYIFGILMAGRVGYKWVEEKSPVDNKI